MTKNMVRKIFRWLCWMPAIFCDFLKHHSVPKAPKGNGDVKNLIFVMFDEFYFFKFDLLLAEFLGRTHGRTVVVLSNYNHFVGIYCRFLGVETVTLPQPNKIASDRAIRVLSAFAEACFDPETGMVDRRKAVDFLYEGIPYGKFIISDILGRTRTANYANIFLDTHLKKNLLWRLSLSFSIEVILNDHKNVERFIFNEKNFLPANVISFMAADNFRIFEWKPTHKRHEICVKSFNSKNWYTHPFSLEITPSDFEQMLKNDKDIPSGERLLKEKYQNNNWYNRDILIEKYQESSSKLTKELQVKKPVGVVGIFPHIFWDATFSYGENFFIDYKSLFEELFQLIPKHPDILFVVKFHPDYSFKNVQANQHINEDYNAMLLNLLNFDNVVLFYPDEAVNLFDILVQIDTIVTVRGTVGIEAALLGKNVSVFGSGRYSDYGFTHLYKTIEDFDEDLRLYKGRKPAPEATAKRASLFWRELYDKTPINLKSFLTFSSHGSNSKHPLRINYVINSWIDVKSDAARKLSEIFR